ncbi:hypothetical protein BDK51DRAFT_4151, partial [Blyttiomyces helicus]
VTEGDYFLINRQPSLTKHSIMAFNGYANTQSRTISFNPLLDSCFNADFDGDEMNAHMLCSEKSIKEGRERMSISACLKSSQNSTTSVPLLQDVMVGMYLLSDPDLVIPEYVWMSCIGYGLTDESIIEYKCRLLRNDCNMFSGSSLLSSVFPRDFVFSYESEGILFTEGIHRTGRLKSPVVNSKGMRGGLLDAIIDRYRYDPNIYCDFVTNLSRVVNIWLQHRSLTTSISECYIYDNDEQMLKDKLKDIVKEDEVLLDEAYGDQHTEEKEIATRKSISSVRNGLVFKARIKSNVKGGMEEIMYSGSKGNYDNVVQMRHLLGQQIVSDQRPQVPLIHFKGRELSPEARGMCYSSLSEGLEPWEMFYHAQAGRESIVIMGTQTSDTGYSQRKLVKFMENIVVSKHGVVKHSNGKIVQ